MSVLTCGRRGCDNIMCDRHSCEHGYICNSCFEELILCGAETNISKFMDSHKSLKNIDAARARFNIEFSMR